MRYVWDPAKDVLNQRKHGLSLAEGIPALEDPQRDSWIDRRFDYGEERIVTLGMGRILNAAGYDRTMVAKSTSSRWAWAGGRSCMWSRRNLAKIARELSR
jgi:uncharacterized DUF497 family protein